ncbi:hypothetical protein SAMN02745181_3769 [Rubritalea squalenifaciens DSM 18772]|uniref:Uncharacterized protein n=1 Tax=Rubritalea squalenifaciens DSM 18772 TaxID=1123071 RepID=A0A1M6SAE0_9BACT|nr:hypothetical protein [Rubritalea squalenifaciens]SHK41734.1 hypothetical protein SAMN02745181_3769 [Rubritalea squalenifaciens DSM 18772]
MKTSLLPLLLTLIGAPLCQAVERMEIAKVNTDSLTTETQVYGQNVGEDHMLFIWWMPFEFWQSTISQDNTLTDLEKKEFLETLEDYSLVAIVQGDFTTLGTMKFYSREEVNKNLKITYQPEKGPATEIFQEQNISPELNVLLNIFKPMLAQMMGNMGSSMHFFVLKNTDGDDKKIIDPYQKGSIHFQVAKRKDKAIIKDKIDMPLNSLYIPRKCPNGKDAHISWKYCPWTGKKLPE